MTKKEQNKTTLWYIALHILILFLSFSGVFSKITELETEDLILLLILYLMYRESHDEQYLIILGIMLFL